MIPADRPLLPHFGMALKSPFAPGSALVSRRARAQGSQARIHPAGWDERST